MSVTFSLTSLAIAAAISAVSGMAAVRELNKDRHAAAEGEPVRESEVIQTRFADKQMLVKTLTEHGFEVQELENGDVVLTTNAGKIRYFLDTQTGSYLMQCYDLKSDAELEEHEAEIEEEYLLNVQKSTYLMLKEKVGARDDMELESEEFMEDGTVLLTINV